jgi:ABC-type sugar transport system ATPase subunit
MKIHDLFITYEREKEINWSIRKDDLSIEPGDAISLKGPNMSGKTSIIQLLSGTLPVEAKARGSLIHDDGRSFSFPMHTTQSKNLGIVSVHQDDIMFPDLSIFENIIIGYNYNYRGEIEGRLKGTYVEDILNFLGVSGHQSLSNLSAGGTALIRFARAVLSDYRLLIMDEPTSSLDDQYRDVLFSIISSTWSQESSYIFTSHNERDHEKFKRIARNNGSGYSVWELLFQAHERGTVDIQCRDVL